MPKTKRALTLWTLALVGSTCLLGSRARADDPWIVLEGKDGPGAGKHIVFVAGDDEYRSEEVIPALARIAAAHHGFKCTVLLAVNTQTGEIDPGALDNIPGLEALDKADMMVLFLRFRELPDDQMKHIIDFTNSGKPMMGLRTTTHAFNYRKLKDSPYAKYSCRSKDPKGGWGRWVLGETWAGHYGHHGKESTRGRVAKGMENSPVVRGCDDIWGPSDVYGITTLEGECTPLVMGHVLVGMDPKDEPNTKKKPVPVAWLKKFKGAGGKTSRVFATTMGHGDDLKSEGFRRLLINGIYWGLGMEDKIPPKAKVDFLRPYNPNKIGMGGFKKGLKPADHKL